MQSEIFQGDCLPDPSGEKFCIYFLIDYNTDCNEKPTEISTMTFNETKPLKTIQAVEEEIIQEFQQLDDIDAKYIHLFQLGTEMPPMNPALKTDQNLVDGCQSKLWFHLAENDDKLTLSADSDSLVIKAIAALLVRIIEGRSPEEVQTINLDFIDDLKIWKLASERNNGLIAMLDHIKAQAKEIRKDKQTESFRSEA